ncbi:MAG: hypothetical protein NZ561_03825 [Phycisphaerae bacterium]|nr:hypothetical protein [Phycisphaerae bacterium]MDW8261323.1 hypothetical protein [Phycisphaerales bacterium]
MLNDVREPPLEPEFAERLKSNHRLDPSRPVLVPPGPPIADVELHKRPMTESAFTAGVAVAVFGAILAIVFAIVFWVWL